MVANKACGTPQHPLLLHVTAALIKKSTFDTCGHAVAAEVTSRTMLTITIFAANGALFPAWHAQSNTILIENT